MKALSLTKALLALSAVVLCPKESGATELIANGDFSAGLAGWSTYTTIRGSLGVPTVTTFDLTGSGLQNSARLEVGKSVSLIDVVVDYQGGGLVQTFSTSGGSANFNASIAALNPFSELNYSAGLFSVLLDGVEMDSVEMELIQAGQTLRGDLSFSTILAPGIHTLSLQALRDGRNEIGRTPYQYFGNVSLSTSAQGVPEPSTWLMMLIGFGLTGGTMRLRRQHAVRVAL